MEIKPSHADPKFLAGGGEMGRLIRAHDWSRTPLGPADTWPLSLRSALTICLNSGFPIAIYWGPDHLLLYNDAWSSIPAKKHPWALGRPAAEVWPEIWPQIRDQFHDVLYSGESVRSPDTLLPMERKGYVEECYFDYTLSPILDAEGRVGGIFNAVIETSYRVIMERRQLFLHTLVQLIHKVDSRRTAFALAHHLLEAAPQDIPFCLLYDWNGRELVLQESVGMSAEDAAAFPWPFSDAVRSNRSVAIPDLKALSSLTLPSIWPEPCTEALLITLRQVGEEIGGFLVAGLSPRKRLDPDYQNFLESVAVHIGTFLVQGTTHDEERAARDQLQKSESNLRNMILQAPVAMCIFKGPEYVVEIANERMFGFWGRKAGDVLHKPIFEGLPEAKDQGFEELLHGVYHNGVSFSASEVQVALPRGNGVETVYVNFMYEPFREGDGITGVMAIAIEVTDQVLSRKFIEEAEERARLAVDSAELGTYEVNLETDEIISSPRMNEIFGIPYPAERGAFISVFPPQDREIRDRAYAEAYRTGKLEYEGRVQHGDGSLHWIRIKGRIIFDESGKPRRLIGVVQDITEQKTFSAELSRQVDQRTRALQEANDRLEKSNADLEQFAYVTSHDLQEPLRKIHLFNGMLLEKMPAEAEGRRYAEKVAESSRRMSGLIKDLLEYSRLSRVSSQFEKVNLNRVLTNVLSDFELLIAQKNARVRSNVLATIEAIPLQMNQLLFNLLGNALKFSRPDVRPEITIRGGMVSPERRSNLLQLLPEIDYYELSVEDNGIGFEPQYADKIFTIFQRLNERSLYGGYGIGLAVCKKIAETHQGIIIAEGSPGAGARFDVILPVEQPRI